MDSVFKALADQHRRALLDRLFERDGQSLRELEQGLEMTRHGVMKHLGVLERAGLITTERQGRLKLHYLNRVPIRLLHDRWIDKYTEPWAATLADLKTTLEKPMTTATQLQHRYELLINSPQDTVWKAITDPASTPQWFFGTVVESDWKVGSPIEYTTSSGATALQGEVVEFDPPNKLVHTFNDQMGGGDKDAETLVTWQLETVGELTRVLLIHSGFEGETTTFKNTQGGWATILSGLKTLLETGKALPMSKV